MTWRILQAGCLLAIGCAVHAQTGDQKPTFEVAMVKPSTDPQTGPLRGFGRANGGPGTNSPGQFTATGMSLKNLLFLLAYQFKPYQYDAPAWMDKEIYDVVAKVPPGITRDQFRVMLQDLLVERFQITFHNEQKDFQVYDLVVAKGGPKMKAPPVDEKAAAKPGPGPGGSFHLDKGPDGFPAIPAGLGPVTLATGVNGQSVLVTNKYSMQQLADMLSRNLNKQVHDKTGLTGDYAFTLHYLPDNAPTPTGAASAAVASEAVAAGTIDMDAVPTIFTALQSQLGLKLEQRKEPVDVMVIDHAEKVPIGN